jgi:leader peptidase (prepilin peptidase) / N-methyltransferase
VETCILSLMRIFGATIAGLLGLACGSFLNVCLTRWTSGESVVSPRSHCRACGRSLRWWENIPLASYLFLGGRCRTCGVAIGIRYPIVELSVGCTWAIATWQQLPALYLPGWTRISIFDADFFGLVKMLLSYLLVALAVLDAEHLWLPDKLTLGGALLGLPLSLARFGVHLIWRLPLHWSFQSGLASHRAHLYDAFLLWLFGMLAIPAAILSIRWAYRLFRGREGIGVGDVKLLLMLAVWIGFSHTLLALMLGILLGFVTAVLMLFRRSSRKTLEAWAAAKLPFGTFLCIGGIVSALWGGDIIRAYLSLAGF